MDEWEAMLDGRNLPYRSLEGTTNGRVVSTLNTNQHRKPVLNGRATSMLEDEIEEARNQLFDRLKISKNTINASGNIEASVYEKYNFERLLTSSHDLPVYKKKDEILATIEKHPTVVIEGSTGCGKSTQIPQMILDEAYANKKHCNIIVTQPRRIAARSIASRISEEREWELGSVVGYQIGLDKRYVSEDTAILFCTSGILLEKLIKTKSLKAFTHIILDEVHERDKDIDFLFIIIRWLMSQPDSTNTKIILMSATIETEKFAEYFKYFTNRWFPAPVINVATDTLFNVPSFYLEDLDIQYGHMAIQWDKPSITDDMYQIVRTLIRKISVLEIEENAYQTCGSILIFVPGIHEIGRLYTILDEFSKKTDDNWKLIILHSMVSTDDQRAIFKAPQPGFRKIILSTNIAESSITVPDVKYVVDFCLTKFLTTNRMSNFTSLEMDWASKSSLQQRAGRAGRVSDGRCFRMVPKKFFDYYMRDFSIPELLLTPLENVILKAKEFDMEKPHIIIGLAMDAPKISDIATTILSLKELGALLLEVRNEGFSDIDGDLTFLGKMMAALPIDVRATRLIAIGYCFGVLDECTIIAACLTSKKIFQMCFGKDINAYCRRLEWSNGSGCDLISMLNAYKIWSLKHHQREFGMTDEQSQREREFCQKHHLNSRSLQECHLLVQELKSRLLGMGIRDLPGPNQIQWNETQKVIILKMVICGAFYPNIFTTDTNNDPTAEHRVYHVLNGRDPLKTVFFSGFPKDNIRQLYVKRIQNLFLDVVNSREESNNIKISFDGDSEKVFVTFDSEKCLADTRNHWETMHATIPGRISAAVYKAIKMRQARIPMQIAMLAPSMEQQLAEDHGLGRMDGRIFVPKDAINDVTQMYNIPDLLAEHVTGIITHVETCSKFWLQPDFEAATVVKFRDELNANKDTLLEPFSNKEFEHFNKAIIIAATDQTDGKLNRARLMYWHPIRNGFECTVRFIDTGKVEQMSNKHLYKFKCAAEQSTEKPKCYHCCLTEVQPFQMNMSGGNMWEKNAIQFMETFAKNAKVKAEIYSVVNGIVHVKVTKNNACLNTELIKKHFADACEESYLSKLSYYTRHSAIKQAQLGASSLAQNDNTPEECYPIMEADAIDVEECRLSIKTIKLNGPKSPLERQIYSANSMGRLKSITIDMNSVNSVLLSTAEDEGMIKYVVAAHTSQKGMEDKSYVVHETTLLPNIPGFGSLMAMIFAPRFHLKRDEARTRFVSVLTGLGHTKEKGPIFPQHDNVFYFDFEFDEDDLNHVNQIRYSIDTLLYSHDEVDKKHLLSDSNRFNIMKKAKIVIEHLLRKERAPLDIVVSAHEWDTYDKDDLLERIDMYRGRSIFPIQNSLKLYPMDIKLVSALKAHCNDLYDRSEFMRGETICRLCNVNIDNVTILRVHLMSRLHQDREKRIGFSRSLI